MASAGKQNTACSTPTNDSVVCRFLSPHGAKGCGRPLPGDSCQDHARVRRERLGGHVQQDRRPSPCLLGLSLPLQAGHPIADGGGSSVDQTRWWPTCLACSTSPTA